MAIPDPAAVCWGRSRSVAIARRTEREGNTMVELLDLSSGKLIGLKVSGKLLHEDYQHSSPCWRSSSRNTAASLSDRDDRLQGIEPVPCGTRSSSTSVTASDREVRRRRRSGLGSLDDQAVSADFFNAEIRYFDVSERDKAWEWIQEGL